MKNRDIREISEVSDSDKVGVVDMIAEKVIEKLKKRICRRCHSVVFESGDYCDKCQVIIDEEVKFNVEKEIKRFEVNCGNVQREIDFKQSQVDSEPESKPKGIVESRVMKYLEKGEPVILDTYSSGLKPVHILLNEIDELKGRKQLFIKQLEHLRKQLEVKNASANDSGNKE